MKKLFTLLFFLTSIVVVAQNDTTKNWTIGGEMGLNSSQVGFTNWAQGGENTVSGLAFFNIHANFKSGIWYWENYLGSEYGLMQQGDGVTKKTNDLIVYRTKAGRDFNKALSMTFFGSFRTQYTKGYDYAKSTDVYISSFMAPAYTILGLGLNYKPADYLAVYLSPATYKQTLVVDDTLAYYGAFGVQKQDIDSDGNIIPFKNVRNELGAYFDLTFKKDIAKNVNLLTVVNLFSNYLDNPQNVDVNWRLELTMKVNSWLQASIKTQMIYDDDIMIAGDENPDGTYSFGPKLQFMEAVAVGVKYSFGE